MKNLEKHIINPTNEFHILRHFKFVDDAYKETLVNQEYWYYDYAQKKFVSSIISQIDIQNALETIGTKFDGNIVGIENPKKLLYIIKQHFEQLLSTTNIKWIDNSKDKTISFTFDYKSNIGEINCLAISKIPKEKRIAIKTASRSDCIGENEIMVNTVSGFKLSSTKTIYVELKRINQFKLFAVTAFPDCSICDDVSDDELVFVM